VALYQTFQRMIRSITSKSGECTRTTPLSRGCAGPELQRRSICRAWGWDPYGERLRRLQADAPAVGFDLSSHPQRDWKFTANCPAVRAQGYASWLMIYPMYSEGG